MKKFEIPEKYKSSIIAKIKELRKENDPRKKNFEPTELDFGPVRFYIARHFGFCYGVQNAIEIANDTIENNPGRRIFLLSEMIHNPAVNDDLLGRGVQFIMDTEGNNIIDWSELSSDDIVVIPAFGTTLEIEEKLNSIGIDPYKYNTTCPFVEKVWNKSDELGRKGYTVIIHGKHKHEETRATFSHSNAGAPSVIVRDIEEAKTLGEIILGNVPGEKFYTLFENKHSQSFDVNKDLTRAGVVNQTTMLASETEEISEYFREVMIKKYGVENLARHFADTRDTLCYATNDNQSATYGLLEKEADLAIVVGGYNSSNTTHIVELLESKFPSYFISSAGKIISPEMIEHFDIHSKKVIETEGYLPKKDKIDVVLTSGASCPDSMVDEVMVKILSYQEDTLEIEEVLKSVAG
jgi:4-hydroxy-3-methylbut-2-enyl diphosphate reductase